MNVLALSGSLRAASINSMLLRAMARLISIPLLGVNLSESAMMATPSVASAIRESLEALRQGAQSLRAASSPTFSIR
jgi:hypothetical protein